MNVFCEGCVEKPVSTLWRNYVGSNRPDVSMRLTVTNGGLTATTKDHGLTEYWAHRVTYCTAPASHPRLFVWVYRHEGRRLRPELRCHAALCTKESTARRLATILNTRLQQALLEFRRDKVSRQNARLSLANAVYENPSLPRRKLLLSTGGSNYRPPLERSKSAPKLSAIEEDAVAEELEQQRFLEELRSAAAWHDHDSWRLARLLELALQRESSDENGSISSGCETASTANSEERPEEAHLALAHEADMHNGTHTNDKTLTESMAPSSISESTTNSSSTITLTECGGPRRNSDETINRSAEFYGRHFGGCDEDGEAEGEEEDEDDEVVDLRPRGESPILGSGSGQCASRTQNDSCGCLSPTRRDRSSNSKSPKASSPNGHLCHIKSDEVDSLESPIESTPKTPHGILGSLDEEETDSDESGYVEASPKNSIERPINDCDDDDNSSLNEKSQHESSPIQDLKSCKNETVTTEFIKCPISETIKKFTEASLRSSKPTVRPKPPPRPAALSAAIKLRKVADFDGESPSLLQRKRLLAQHGVTV
ncbi:hypothetical protein QAD02_004356 [Eretmocerus hayati]|uniref:Uncharacterized protein n=1 Tax=Eretmocerus hayati TaxID=131215 RepID=A0ACC2NU59_9HYME|nr:hypothetical protein QAD02_004356 [Eretmocerus hayati]